MLPAASAPYLFSLVLSGIMSLIVSAVATFRAVGLVDDFTRMWLSAWLVAWAVAFPCLLLLAPAIRKLVTRLTG